MAECLELSCVSAKIMLFLLELCSLRTVLQEQKLELTNNCRNNKPLKGMLTSSKHRLPFKPNFILSSHYPSQLFIWEYSSLVAERSCSNPVTFQLILI